MKSSHTYKLTGLLSKVHSYFVGKPITNYCLNIVILSLCASAVCSPVYAMGDECPNPLENNNIDDIFYFGGHPDYTPDSSRAMGTWFSQLGYLRDDRIFHAGVDGLFDFAPLHNHPNPTLIIHAHMEYLGRFYLTGYGAIENGVPTIYTGSQLGDPFVKMDRQPREMGLEGVLRNRGPWAPAIKISQVQTGAPMDVPYASPGGFSRIVNESLSRARQRFNIAPLRIIFSGCLTSAPYDVPGRSFAESFVSSVDGDTNTFILNQNDIIEVIGTSTSTKMVLKNIEVGKNLPFEECSPIADNPFRFMSAREMQRQYPMIPGDLGNGAWIKFKLEDVQEAVLKVVPQFKLKPHEPRKIIKIEQAEIATEGHGSNSRYWGDVTYDGGTNIKNVGDMLRYLYAQWSMANDLSHKAAMAVHSATGYANAVPGSVQPIGCR